MKPFIVTIFVLLSLAMYAQNREVEIMAFKSVQIDCPVGAPQEITIKSFSPKGLVVAVLDVASSKQVKGFGLGPKAQAEVSFSQGQVLKLTNNTAGKALVKLSFSPVASQPAESDGTYITFTLSNNSLRAIPLIIPGVMNPNLSPLSGSGVRLKTGQEIFFRYKGRETLLLVVSKEIKEGQKIDVAELINKRKQSL